MLTIERLFLLVLSILTMESTSSILEQVIQKQGYHL